MILTLTKDNEQTVFYSADVIQKIKEINHELEEVYPECGEYCKRIEEVISESLQT